jgi:methylglyoxal synthase
MSQKKISMEARKSIALIAHDSMKDDLLEWTSENKKALTQSTLYATGTTGRILSRELGIDVHIMGRPYQRFVPDYSDHLKRMDGKI